MARINFEDRIFRDQGFQDLMIAVQSRLLAKGIVLELFQLAQEFWFPNQKPIPFDRFEAAGFPEALFAPGGLCEKRPDGVYVRGSKDQFAWLFEKSAGGTVRAVTAERDENGRFKTKEVTRPRKASSKKPAQPSTAGDCSSSTAPATVQHNSSITSSSQALTLYSSLSSPSLTLNSLKLAPRVKDPQAQLEESVSPTAKVWRAYKAAYRSRYGQDPTYNAKVLGQMKAFVGRVPAAEAPDIAQFYVAHPGTSYVRKLHDFGLCLMDAEGLRTQWLARAPVTDSMISEYRKKAIEPRSRGIAEILADKERQESERLRVIEGGAE